MTTATATTEKTEMTIEQKRDFLKGHFRYNTMNSWNRSTSFAANVKLRQSNYSEKLPDNALDFVGCEDAYFDVNAIIHDFTADMGGHLTIGFNGRSSGYLVLMCSKYETSEHKSLCMNCYQKNFQPLPKGEKGICGKCGEKARVNYEFEKNLVVYAGRSFGEHLDELEDDEIEEMYDEVVKFDIAVEKCKSAFIYYCNTHQMQEQTVMVEKKVMVPVEIE